MRKSWKLIARTISLTSSLFVAQRPSTYSQLGEHGKIVGRLEVGWGKVAWWRTKAAISLKRVQCRYMRSYYVWPIGPHQWPMLFQTLPSPTPYNRVLNIGGSQPPPKTAIAIISRTGKGTDFTLGRYIHRFHLNKSPLKIWEKRERRRI